jgi:osmoprotectant transport system substrate-binding protein
MSETTRLTMRVSEAGRPGERRSARRSLVVVAVMAVLAAACGGADEIAVDRPPIVVRGQDFSEARTLAKVYALHLESLGYPVEILTAAGFRTEAIAALEAGEVNLIIDYIGGSLSALRPDAAASGDPDAIMAVIRPAYAELGARALAYTPAVDGDALVVRGDFPAQRISDLVGLDADFGSAAQCYERPQCYLGLTDPSIYGISFGATRTIEFGPLLGEALKAGEVDVVMWNDTAPQIGVEGFRVLIDDRGLFSAQNIAPIVSESLIAAYGNELIAVLDALSARITTADLVAWNVETDLAFREPIDVAREWLTANGLLG